MKLLIDVEKDYYEIIKYNVEHGQEYKPFEIIANGIPVSTEGDSISRKWLTDAIRNRRTYLSYEDAKDVIDLINNAPSVDIKDQIAGAYNEGYACGSRENKRPQGEWIEVDIKPMPYGGYTCNRKCNKCGYFTKEYRLNFCPNCGADMRKGGVE